MDALYSEIASGILQVVCAMIGILLTAVIVPWIKASAIPWLKEKQLYGLCTKFVRAAEKLAKTGAIDKAEKKKYVVKLLTDKGVKVTPEVDAFIESAVEELDLAVESGIGLIAKEFTEGDPAVETDSTKLKDHQENEMKDLAEGAD